MYYHVDIFEFFPKLGGWKTDYLIPVDLVSNEQLVDMYNLKGIIRTGEFHSFMDGTSLQPYLDNKIDDCKIEHSFSYYIRYDRTKEEIIEETKPKRYISCILDWIQEKIENYLISFVSGEFGVITYAKTYQDDEQEIRDIGE